MLRAHPTIRPRITRRAVVLAVIALLLGAATTVGIAWIGACFPARTFTPVAQDYIRFDSEPFKFSMSRLGPCMTEIWWRHEPEGIGLHGISVIGRNAVPEGTSTPPRWCSIWRPEQRRPALTANLAVPGPPTTDVTSGWPFRAMRGTVDPTAVSPGAGWWVSGTVAKGPPRTWPTKPRQTVAQSRLVPLVPLWPGFAANTILYAAAWACMIFAPGALARRRRRRQHLCPHCAYDLRATPADTPCPECGHAAHPGRLASCLLRARLAHQPLPDGSVELTWTSDLKRTSFYRVTRTFNLATSFAEAETIGAVRDGRFIDARLPVGFAQVAYWIIPCRQRRGGPIIEGAARQAVYRAGTIEAGVEMRMPRAAAA